MAPNNHLHQQPKIKRMYRNMETSFQTMEGRTTKTRGSKEVLSRGRGESLEGGRDHGGRVSLLLLLHQVFTSQLEGDGETELGGLLSLVNLTSEGERDGHGNALLEETADLTGAVDLSAERGGTEVVLGTNGGGAVTGRATPS